MSSSQLPLESEFSPSESELIQWAQGIERLIESLQPAPTIEQILASLPEEEKYPRYFRLLPQLINLGAEWLDLKHPGWEWSIGLRVEDDHPLLQIFGSYERGIRELNLKVPPEDLGYRVLFFPSSQSDELSRLFHVSWGLEVMRRRIGKTKDWDKVVRTWFRRVFKR